MIPQNDGLNINFQFQELPTNTYRLKFDKDTITGQTDRLEAMIQAIFLILNIERYDYLIYSWNYGIELVDLFGKPIPYAIPEIKRRITEALTQDKRITGVTDFDFDHRKGKVFTTFTVNTIFGDVQAGKEVDV